MPNDRRESATFGPWERDEPASEIGVDGQGFADVEFLHHHETQAVGDAVGFVPMLLEVLERGPLLIRRRPMNTG